MKKNRGTKVIVWLLVLLQLVVCTALAETVATQITTITNLTTFNAFDQTGNYTVRFLKEPEQPADAEQSTQEDKSANAEVADENVICTFENVDYETPISTLMAQLPEEYADTLWSVTPDYLTLNSVDITRQGEAVAILNGAPYSTLQAAIEDVPEGSEMNSTIVYLQKDVQENINTKGKSFTLDMGGHTLTAQNGVQAYKQVNGNVTVLQGTITGANTAGMEDAENGAGMSIISGTLKATDVIIEGNTAQYEGGGLYCDGATVNLENCVISKNVSVENSGAGIEASGSTVTLTGTTISGNRTEDGYAAAINASGSIINISNCKVEKNDASRGGAIVLSSSSTLNASGLVLKDNTCDLENPNAAYGSLAIQSGCTAILGSNCSIENNKSFCGGISVEYATFKAEQGLVVRENEGKETGGLSASGRLTLKLIGVRFENNKATEGTGGMQIWGSRRDKQACTVQDCVFTGNEGQTGALWIDTATETTLTGCIIEKNTGTQYAGAIYQGATYNPSKKGLVINNCTITRNCIR